MFNLVRLESAISGLYLALFVVFVICNIRPALCVITYKIRSEYSNGFLFFKLRRVEGGVLVYFFVF